MALASGTLLSVNVGGTRHFEYRGRPAKSEIWKEPVKGRVCDRRVHGGPDKAVYVYAIEYLRWWEAELLLYVCWESSQRTRL